MRCISRNLRPTFYCTLKKKRSYNCKIHNSETYKFAFAFYNNIPIENIHTNNFRSWLWCDTFVTDFFLLVTSQGSAALSNAPFWVFYSQCGTQNRPKFVYVCYNVFYKRAAYVRVWFEHNSRVTCVNYRCKTRRLCGVLNAGMTWKMSWKFRR